VLPVLPGPPDHVRLLVPSQVMAGEPFFGAMQAFDALDNAVSLDGTLLDGGTLRVQAEDGGGTTASGCWGDQGRRAVPFRMVVDEPGVHRLYAEGPEQQVRSNPVEVLDCPPAFGLYWGEIHGHSCLSDGTADPDAYFAYGRDVARLDFCALTDHDTWLTPEKWTIIRHLVSRYHESGRFVTFLGFEWTSAQFWTPLDRRFGHKNVYYLGDSGDYFNHLDPRYDSPEKLWAALDPEQALTIAHHPAYLRDDDPCWGTDWRHHDEQMEPLVEIYSKHGLSERPGTAFPLIKENPEGFVCEALARGYHLGFVGGSDTHLSRPGSLQLEQRRGARYPWSGLTAVYAPALTRAALFGALRSRRTYATTGARILVDFRLNGAWMGETVPWAPRREIAARVAGTAPIERVELIRNNRVWQEALHPGENWTGEWADEDEAGAWAAPEMPSGLLFYYLQRVKVAVRVHGALQRHTDGAGQVELDVASGTTVAEVMARLGVPEVEVFSVVLNHDISSEEAVLQEADRVDLIPPIGGGT